MWIVSAGCIEIDPPAGGLFDQAADLALDLRRRERKPLVGPARADAERLGLPVAERLEDGRGQRSKSCGPRPAYEKLAMPNTRPNALAHLVPRRSGPSSISIRPMTERTLDDVEAGERRAQIADEHLNEPGAVPALERQLLVVHDDGVHESVTGHRSAVS